MFCEKCIHYEVCDLNRRMRGNNNPLMYDKECRLFKDKSLYIELPCKVGDTVYAVSQGAGFSVVWNVYEATAKAIYLDQWGKLFVRAETDKNNVGGYVEIERLFLTREEAEKALAERVL